MVGGSRLAKDDWRIEAYGTLDELSATLGMAASGRLEPQLSAILKSIQAELFVIGAELATPESANRPVPPTSERQVSELE